MYATEQPATAPINLPGHMAKVHHLVRENVRISYAPESRTLTLSNISSRDFVPIAGCKAVLRTDGTETELEPIRQGWQTSDTPVDWLVIVDESDSMRLPSKKNNRRAYIKEAIDITHGLVDTMRSSDSLQISLLSTKLNTFSGRISGGDTEAKQNLHSELTRLANETANKKASWSGWTALFHLISMDIMERRRDGFDPNRRHAIVLLTDAGDDTSPSNSCDDLVRQAKEAGVHICSAVFYHKDKRTQVNTIEALSVKTDALYAGVDTPPDAATINELCTKLNCREHYDYFSVELELPEQLPTSLKLSLQAEDGKQLCQLELSEAELAQIISKFTPKEITIQAPIVGTGSDGLLEQTEAELLVQSTMQQIAEGEKLVTTLAELENSTTVDGTAMQTAVTEIRKLFPELIHKATELKKQAPEDCNKALNEIRTSDGDESARLSRLRAFCDSSNITPDNIGESDILALLGRNQPLPTPPANPTLPAEEQKPAWLISAVITALVAIVLLIFTKRGRLRKRRILAVLEQTGTDVRWEITKEITTIGKDACNDIVIADSSVSASHCTLKHMRNGKWELVDMNSTNKIYADGEILTTLTLRDGTEFELGKVKLRFRIC